MSKLLCAVIGLSLCLVSCVGGNSDGAINDAPQQKKTESLIPLKISIADESGNSIPYVDISKIGSHVIYKLGFTNTNSVPIALVFGYDSILTSNYFAAQAESLGIPTESYWNRYNPGQIMDGYIKTQNPDDCSQNNTLEPNAYCAYYMYAFNLPINYNLESMFTIPVTYTVVDVANLRNRLDVYQCTLNIGDLNGRYNCSNMSKPGFSSQFISYKMLPVSGTSNYKGGISYNTGSGVSNDGNWSYDCSTKVCNKSSMIYNRLENTLTQSAVIESININLSGYRAGLYTVPDGSRAFVTTYSDKKGYLLVDTKYPDVTLDSYCYTGHCVPYINNSSFDFGYQPGVVGLDGSFWWNTDDFGADLYIPESNTFVRTNIVAVFGVNPDGVIIGWESGAVSCLEKGNSYMSYINRGELKNYTRPRSDGRDVDNFEQNVYIKMWIPGVNWTAGSSYYGGYAYYKIHTENGKCEIDLNDYTAITIPFSTTTKYLINGIGANGTGLVAPSDYLYTGL